MERCGSWGGRCAEQIALCRLHGAHYFELTFDYWLWCPTSSANARVRETEHVHFRAAATEGWL